MLLLSPSPFCSTPILPRFGCVPSAIACPTHAAALPAEVNVGGGGKQSKYRGTFIRALKGGAAIESRGNGTPSLARGKQKLSPPLPRGD